MFCSKVLTRVNFSRSLDPRAFQSQGIGDVALGDAQCFGPET